MPWGWAIVIVLGQFVILATAWVLFAVLYHYGPIPIPDKMAARVAKSQRIVALIVTLIATALSLISALYVKFLPHDVYSGLF